MNDVADPLIDYAEFVAGFHRSQRGNLSRQWNGDTLTVFWRQGAYRYCIFNPEETRYCNAEFQTEDDALVALAKEVMAVLKPI